MQPCPANTYAAGWAKTLTIPRFASGTVALILVCLMPVGARAATAPTTLRLSEYQKQDWQVEDGLPENYVRMLTQRPDGVLLLATSFGLATFDGQRFQNEPIEADGLVDNEAVNTYFIAAITISGSARMDVAFFTTRLPAPSTSASAREGSTNAFA
jgi:hypothetical protein